MLANARLPSLRIATRMIDGCVSTESGSDRIERLRQSHVQIPSLPLRVLTRCAPRPPSRSGYYPAAMLTTGGNR